MNFLVFLAESFAEGAVILPNIIFAGLIFEHFGAYEYIMPFVLLYAFEKAGTFAIQGFGRINNPYRILRVGILIAVFGSFITLGGYTMHVLWSIGASLIGIGLSIYIPFYKTVTDCLKENNLWKFKNSSLKGYLFLAIFTIVSMMIRRTSMNYVFAIFTLTLCGTAWFIFNLEVTDDLRNNKMFIPHGLGLRYFIPSLLIFLLTFFTRGLKQTSNMSYIFYMLITFCLLILTDFFYKKRNYRIQSLQSMWYGAVRNFFTIYSLIYFIAVGKYVYVSISYLMIAVALICAMVISPVIKKKVTGSKYECFCILAASLSSLLVLVPHMYMVGVLLGCMFVSMGNSSALKAYLKDGNFIKFERRLVKARFYSLGSVIQQVFLLTVLVVMSKVMFSDSKIAISSYAFYMGNPKFEHIFFITRLICVLGICISGVYMIYKTKRKNL